MGPAGIRWDGMLDFNQEPNLKTTAIRHDAVAVWLHLASALSPNCDGPEKRPNYSGAPGDAEDMGTSI
jgi:hypothetical protein